MKSLSFLIITFLMLSIGHVGASLSDFAHNYARNDYAQNDSAQNDSAQNDFFAEDFVPLPFPAIILSTGSKFNGQYVSLYLVSKIELVGVQIKSVFQLLHRTKLTGLASVNFPALSIEQTWIEQGKKVNGLLVVLHAQPEYSVNMNNVSGDVGFTEAEPVGLYVTQRKEPTQESKKFTYRQVNNISSIEDLSLEKTITIKLGSKESIL